MPTNAGSYSILANFTPTDTANYNSVTNVAVGTFVINKATPTLSVNGPVTYNGGQQAATVTASVPGTTNNVLYGGLPTAPTDAGTYVVTADFTPNDTTNYNSLNGAPAGSFTIDKAATTTAVTCTAGPFTYRGGDHPLRGDCDRAGRAQPGATGLLWQQRQRGHGHGQLQLCGHANYLASSDGKTFTIDQAATTTAVTCAPGPFTYTGGRSSPARRR